VALGIGVPCNKNTFVINGNALFFSIGGCSPFEVEDVVLKIVPVLAQVFSNVKFLVNLARLVLEF